MTVEEMIAERDTRSAALSAALTTALAAANTVKGGTASASVSGLADDLATELAAANAAVSTKGGTVIAQNLSRLPLAIASIPQSGAATITIVSPTTTTAQIADALRAAVSASITRFIAIRELPLGTNECIAVCWSESANEISIYRNDPGFGYMRRFSYGVNQAPVPQGAVFKIYGWGD